MAQKSTNTAPKLFLVVLIVALIAVAAWYLMPKGDQVPEHIGSGNGRIEATEVDIATRIPGRLESNPSKSARATWLKPACCWL